MRARKITLTLITLLTVTLFVASAAACQAGPQSADLEVTSGRPTGIPVSLEAEWIAGSDVDLTTQSVALKLPLLRIGTPPPIVKLGVAFTDLETSDEIDFRGDLFEYSFGLATVKKLNERWTVRTVLGMNHATDNRNTSSDAWRFTGGVFAIYKKQPNLDLTFGALALGRSDLPVVPVIGAVWLPSPTTRVDLILPNPKVNFLISDNGRRQGWAYLGGGFNGKTWGVERTDQSDDALTYRDLRIVGGFESRPSAPVNAPFVPGRKFGAELGYAFSRSIEFERPAEEIDLDDAIVFRISTRY